MAKKVGFTDKLRRAASGEAEKKREFVKLVKAVKTESGHWRFRTQVVEITDDNRKELMG